MARPIRGASSCCHGTQHGSEGTMTTIDTTHVLWGLTTHPDTPLRGREHVRHMIKVDSGYGTTLCGRRVAWVFDYATPLSPTCLSCERASRAPNAEWCARGWGR